MPLASARQRRAPASDSCSFDGAQFSPLEKSPPKRKRRSQQEKLEEDLDNEEQRRLQDERDETGKNGGEGGAAAGGITIAGSAVDDEPKCPLTRRFGVLVD